MEFNCCCFCKYADVGIYLDELVHCSKQDCDVRYDSICGHYENYSDFCFEKLESEYNV